MRTITYTCLNCRRKSVFHPSDQDQAGILEYRGPDKDSRHTGPDVFYPVCPHCGTRNRIAQAGKT
jgi:hypothetical protein